MSITRREPALCDHAAHALADAVLREPDLPKRPDAPQIALPYDVGNARLRALSVYTKRGASPACYCSGCRHRGMVDRIRMSRWFLIHLLDVPEKFFAHHGSFSKEMRTVALSCNSVAPYCPFCAW